MSGFQPFHPAAGNRQLSPAPTVTIIVDRAEFERVMLAETTLEELPGSGAVTVDGDLGGLQRMLGSLVEFEPLFELLPGTASS